MFFQYLLLAVVARCCVASTDGWYWSKGTDLCGGFKRPCTNVESCTTVAVGPCQGDKSSPDAYMESSFVGMAYVDDTSYLRVSDGTSVASSMKIIDASEQLAF